MRRIPWRSLRQPDPDHRYVLSIGVFVVGRWRHVPGFIRRSIPVRRIIRRGDGVVGYVLAADFRRKTFTEMAAFESPEALRRFVAQPGHAAAMRAVRPHIAPGSKIVSAEVYGRDLPPSPAFVAAELEAVPGFADVDRSAEGSPASGPGAGDAPGADARPPGQIEPLPH